MKRFKIMFDETIIQTVTFEVEAENIEHVINRWTTFEWHNIKIYEAANLGIRDGTESFIEIVKENGNENKTKV